MTARFRCILVSALLPGLALAAAVLATAFQDTPAPKSESVKEVCLKCHRPFSTLVERTSNFKAPSGEITTPHRHVPHDSLEEKTIPECDQCHQKRSMPPSASELTALKNQKPNLDFCYKCHHIKEFMSCKTCHAG